MLEADVQPSKQPLPSGVPINVVESVLTLFHSSGAIVRDVQFTKHLVKTVTELGISGAVVRLVQPENVPHIDITELGISGAVRRLVQPINVVNMSITGIKLSSPAFFIYAGTFPSIFPPENCP